MNFKDFEKNVAKIKNLPLPGIDSHFDMVPAFRKKLMKKAKPDVDKAKRAGVMAMFYPDKKSVTRLLLILRNEYPGVHSNQIGFPGGQQETHDKGILQTALRETEEEVGVPQNSITVYKELTEVYIPPSNFLVTPFIGVNPNPLPFKIDPAEVQQLVEVPLNDFLDDSNVMTQNLSTSYAKNVAVPAFELNGFVVWGATAMMLSEIKQLLLKVL